MFILLSTFKIHGIEEDLMKHIAEQLQESVYEAARNGNDEWYKNNDSVTLILACKDGNKEIVQLLII